MTVAATSPGDDEGARLAALRRYQILDTPDERAFDDLTRIIAHVCGTPIAVINLIDERRQWFKSEVGLGVRETGRDVSICAHAILREEMLVVPDTTLDGRFADNPLVRGEPYLRFYAGSPLLTPEGHAIGTLCVLDHVPRTLDAAQRHALRALAAQVMALIELRRANAAQGRMLIELERSAANNVILLNELQHRVKNNLQMIDSLLHLQAQKEVGGIGRDAVEAVRHRLQPLMLMMQQLDGDGLADSIDLGGYLEQVCAGLLAFHAGASSAVRLDARLSPLPVRRETVVPIGLITNEFITNSFKHAFTGGAGTLQVHLDRLEQGWARLALADDGPGLPQARRGDGLGMKLIPSLARQIGGEALWEHGGGARLSISFRHA